MFKRLLQALALCAGLFVFAPAPAPAANFGMAAGVPQALDPPVIAVRGGWHWRRYWRRHRRHHHGYRHRHHRRWHHHRHHSRGSDRHRHRHHGSARERPAAPAPKASSPTLY